MINTEILLYNLLSINQLWKYFLVVTKIYFLKRAYPIKCLSSGLRLE